MSPRLGRLVRILVVLLILTALVLFARAIQWREAWSAMRSTSPGLLALAALVNVASLGVKAIRWWIFLRPIGLTSLWLAVKGTFIGAGLNNVLIANGGDVARVVYVSRATRTDSARILATLALERLFEIVGYVIMLAAAVSLMRLPEPLQRTRPVAFALLAGLAVLVVYLLRHPERAELPVLEGEGLLHRARTYGRSFFHTLTAMSTGARFVGALACSIVVWVLQVGTYHLTAMAAGFDIPLIGTIAALLAVNTGFAVRATPGNLGVFQMLYAVTAAAFGMDKDAAAGVALLIQLQQILPVTVIGIVFSPEMMFRRGRDPGVDAVQPSAPAPDTLAT